jgi:hypothetical protein
MIFWIGGRGSSLVECVRETNVGLTPGPSLTIFAQSAL